MSEYGFHLVRLVLSGTGVQDAEVRFSQGLNASADRPTQARRLFCSASTTCSGQETRRMKSPRRMGTQLQLLRFRHLQMERTTSSLAPFAAGGSFSTIPTALKLCCPKGTPQGPMTRY